MLGNSLQLVLPNKQQQLPRVFGLSTKEYVMHIFVHQIFPGILEVIISNGKVMDFFWEVGGRLGVWIWQSFQSKTTSLSHCLASLCPSSKGGLWIIKSQLIGYGGKHVLDCSELTFEFATGFRQLCAPLSLMYETKYRQLSRKLACNLRQSCTSPRHPFSKFLTIFQRECPKMWKQIQNPPGQFSQSWGGDHQSHLACVDMKPPKFYESFRMSGGVGKSATPGCQRSSSLNATTPGTLPCILQLNKVARWDRSVTQWNPKYGCKGTVTTCSLIGLVARKP